MKSENKGESIEFICISFIRIHLYKLFSEWNIATVLGSGCGAVLGRAAVAAVPDAVPSSTSQATGEHLAASVLLWTWFLWEPTVNLQSCSCSLSVSRAECECKYSPFVLGTVQSWGQQCSHSFIGSYCFSWAVPDTQTGVRSGNLLPLNHPPPVLVPHVQRLASIFRQGLDQILFRRVSDTLQLSDLFRETFYQRTEGMLPYCLLFSSSERKRCAQK